MEYFGMSFKAQNIKIEIKYILLSTYKAILTYLAKQKMCIQEINGRENREFEVTEKL